MTRLSPRPRSSLPAVPKRQASPAALPPGSVWACLLPPESVVPDPAPSGRGCLGLSHWQAHRRRFAIAPSPALEALERLLQEGQPGRVEPSVKVAGDALHAARCVVYFLPGHNLSQALIHIRRFFVELTERAGARFDHRPLATLAEHGLHLDHCLGIAAGLDLRREPGRSRAKLYFHFQKDPEAAGRWADLVTAPPSALDPIIRARILGLGLAYRFDGVTASGTYAVFQSAEANHPKIRELLGYHGSTLVYKADWACLLVKGLESTLHMELHGFAIRELVQHPVVDALEDYDRYLLALPLAAPETGSPAAFTLYYPRTYDGQR